MSIHPSIPKRCVAVIQQALGPEWIFVKQLLVPVLGLEFRHKDMSVPLQFVWDACLCQFKSVWPADGGPWLLAQEQEAASAATALVKLQGWDSGTIPVPDYAELEARFFALQGKQVTALPTGRKPGPPVFQHIRPRRK